MLICGVVDICALFQHVKCKVQLNVIQDHVTNIKYLHIR